MSKKRILIFSLAYYPKHIGGAEVAIKEITDRLSPEAYEFHLVCNRYDSTLPKEEQIGNVHVYRIGLVTKNPSMADLRTLPLQLNKLLYQWFAYRKAKQLHTTLHFNGVWAMMAHATGVPAGLFKKKYPEVPYVLTLQEGDPPEHIEQKMKIFGKRFDRAFTSANSIQVISSFLGKWVKHKGFAGEPVLIPNAVNTTHFGQTYSNEELQQAAAELGKKSGDVFLVTTSRLVHKNAVDDVIRALALLPPHVHFIVYGTGPEEAMLKELAKEKGVANRVHFLGHIDHQEMPKYLKACDIFIRPSRSEGMGISFLEAMAAGLPVIATHEGGIVDFLFDPVRNPDRQPTGFAVDADSPPQIAEAVQKIVTDTELTKRVIENAKQMATEQYDWDLIAKRMQNEVFDPNFS